MHYHTVIEQFTWELTPSLAPSLSENIARYIALLIDPLEIIFNIFSNRVISASKIPFLPFHYQSWRRLHTIQWRCLREHGFPFSRCRYNSNVWNSSQIWVLLTISSLGSLRHAGGLVPVKQSLSNFALSHFLFSLQLLLFLSPDAELWNPWGPLVPRLDKFAYSQWFMCMLFVL